MKGFTDAVIQQLKPKGKKYILSDGEGLYLQVSPKGKKTWLHRYEVGGRRKWYSLGEFPTLSLKDARKKNENIVGISVKGENPTEAENLNPTLRELFEEWFGKGVDKRGKPWSEAHLRNVEYMFKKDVLPKLGERKIKEIGKKDIRLLLENIEERAPNQALQVYRRLNRLFNYGAARDLIEFSPMAALDPVGAQSKKNRYLSEKEIKIFLSTLPKADMAPNTAAALELILRTGQRPSEIAGAHRDEIKDNWWNIPPERTKNNLENRVYLTPALLKLFGVANKHGLYFPSLKDPQRAVSHTVISKALRRSRSGKEKRENDEITIPIEEHFTPHDLRRTCAIGLAELGFSDEIIGALLNHKKQSVTGIYNQYRYDEEKRKALEAWEKKLSSIVSGNAGKIVHFKWGGIGYEC